MKYVQVAGKQVHDHCNHWIDTTQSIQWTSVTPPNLGGEKNRSARSKSHRWHQGNGENPLGSPGSTSNRRNPPPPPPSAEPRLSSQEIRRAEEIGESRLYLENDRKPSVDPEDGYD